MPHPRPDVQACHLVELYEAGMSELQLAQEHRCSRSVIRSRLNGAGIQCRGRAEAAQDTATKVCKARAMLNRSRGVGAKHEMWLVNHLQGVAGLVSWQHPIGAYNVDLALIESAVAVEIQRQTSRKGRPDSLCRDRLIGILNTGWNLLIVYAPCRWKWRGKSVIPGSRYETLDRWCILEKILSFAQTASRNPSSGCKYGVIRGDGKPDAAHRFNLDHWPRVPGF